jgi:hypothetical protein
MPGRPFFSLTVPFLVCQILLISPAGNTAAPPKPLEALALKSSAGLSWELWRGAHGWSLGQISLNGKPLEKPLTCGILALRDVKTGEVR